MLVYVEQLLNDEYIYDILHKLLTNLGLLT